MKYSHFRICSFLMWQHQLFQPFVLIMSWPQLSDPSESASWAKSVNACEEFDSGSPAQAYCSSVPQQNESLSEDRMKLLTGNIHISTVGVGKVIDS